MEHFTDITAAFQLNAGTGTANSTNFQLPGLKTTSSISGEI